ncbi:MAG: RusA family crossover junction endodeoxyribonuclease [Bacteroidaceae bacterium]|nr:RusA family crossover junction endodeoxyribonuclease [Bacteroidaceae bacterium]
MVTITILGKPMSKGRPRFGNGFTYTPKKTIEYENLVRLAWMQSGAEKLSGYISASVYAYFPIPKSVSKKKRAEMCGGFYAKKPDCDNIAKIVLDALNGVAYDDDSQIVMLSVIKRYSEDAKVVVVMGEVEVDE